MVSPKVWINSWSWRQQKMIDSLKFSIHRSEAWDRFESKWFVGSSSTRTFDFKGMKVLKAWHVLFLPWQRRFTGFVNLISRKEHTTKGNHVGRYCHLLTFTYRSERSSQGLTLTPAKISQSCLWQVKRRLKTPHLTDSFIVDVTIIARINAVVWMSFCPIRAVLSPIRWN